jgi:release factor glutamine methyltransferase
VDFLRVTGQHFAGKGFDSPRLEAEYLLGQVLEVDRIGLYLQHDRPLTREEAGRYRGLIRRRLNREPLQWILGGTDFYGIRLELRSGVFIPRPETELLVEATVRELADIVSDIPEKQDGNQPEIRALDIGCGSGAIALALANSVPGITVHGCDVSDVALEVSENNARNLGLEDRVDFGRWDVVDFKIPAMFDQSYHWIIMNPPYVPTKDWDDLPAEVKAEPKAALDGGEDGLVFYQRLLELLPDVLIEKGGISLEVGIGQADDVKMMFTGIFNRLDVIPDYGDVDRVIIGQGYRGSDYEDD